MIGILCHVLMRSYQTKSKDSIVTKSDHLPEIGDSAMFCGVGLFHSVSERKLSLQTHVTFEKNSGNTSYFVQPWIKNQIRLKL